MKEEVQARRSPMSRSFDLCEGAWVMMVGRVITAHFLISSFTPLHPLTRAIPP